MRPLVALTMLALALLGLGRVGGAATSTTFHAKCATITSFVWNHTYWDITCTDQIFANGFEAKGAKK